MRGIKKIKSEKNAFSLAEMLLVLLIMSFLSMAIAPFVTKKVKKDTYRQPHGRFECFWLNDRLIQYNVLETGAGQQEDRTAKGYCEFEPVERAAFYLVQGVGAGGGGAFAATAPYMTTSTATNNYTIPCASTSSSSKRYACSSNIISSFSDSSSASAVTSKWAWVNDVWDDYIPTRTFTMCSGRGGGGSGKGGWVRQFIPEYDENGHFVFDEHGNIIIEKIAENIGQPVLISSVVHNCSGFIVLCKINYKLYAKRRFVRQILLPSNLRRIRTPLIGRVPHFAWNDSKKRHCKTPYRLTAQYYICPSHTGQLCR